MGGSKLTGILHVASQIPELFQTDLGNIDNVVGLIHRRFRVRSTGNGGAEGHDKASEVFI